MKSVAAVVPCLFAVFCLCSFATKTSRAQYNVVNAGNYTGADIGAQINSAFHASGGTPANPSPSWTVAISPGNIFTYSTPIEIPGQQSTTSVQAPVLDCQGSVLNYTGTGDAIIVHGANATGPSTTGAIRNCVIHGSTTDGGAASLIHIRDRLGFTLSHLELENATVCLNWENTTSDGGPGYNEQDYFEHVHSAGCLKHIYVHTDSSGAGSFRYHTVDDWHFSLRNDSPGGAENGLYLDGPVYYDTAGSTYNLRMNSSTGSAQGPAVSMVYVTGGENFFRSNTNLAGENTAGIPTYSVFVNAGTFHNVGSNIVDASSIHGNTSQSNQYVLHPSYMQVSNDVGTDAVVHVEGENTLRQRTCKTDLGTIGTHFWLASYGGNENDCQFQILARNTDNTNQDVYFAGTGAAPVNILYADPLSKGVGIGPGFGTAATGTSGAGYTLEVHGSSAVTNPLVGAGGTQAVRLIDPAGTSVQDYFHGSYPGQPSIAYQQVFYDTSTYSNVSGLTGFASGGNAYYVVYSIANTRGTPSSSSDVCLTGESWDDANYHYHCVATNQIKRVALGSF